MYAHTHTHNTHTHTHTHAYTHTQKEKEVWLGEYHGEKVAIKMMKVNKASQQLLAEASIMT